MAAQAPLFYPQPPAKKLVDEAKREDDAHYNKCCCCHVTKGLLVMGAFELFCLLAEAAAIVATYVLIEIGTPNANLNDTQSLEVGNDQTLVQEPRKVPYGFNYNDYNWVYAQSPLATLCVGVGSAVVGITIVILMMVGVKKLRARLLIPHMVVQVLAILALFAGSALFIYAAVTVSTSTGCSETKLGDACTKILLTFGAFIVVFTIFAGLEVYFLIMTIRGYRYIKEKCRRVQAAPSPYYAMYQQQQRLYQQTLQHQQQQQHMQQLKQQQQQQQPQAQQSQQAQQPQQPSPTTPQQQQPQQANPAAYMYQQQPIYATYAQAYGMPYNYGYRYA